MQDISVVDIIKAIGYIEELLVYVPSESDVYNYIIDITEPLNDIVEKCKSGKKCPRCGSELLYSDLPQYDYVCAECDENF